MYMKYYFLVRCNLDRRPYNCRNMKIYIPCVKTGFSEKKFKYMYIQNAFKWCLYFSWCLFRFCY